MVTYLGFEILQGQRRFGTDRKEAICQIPRTEDSKRSEGFPGNGRMVSSVDIQLWTADGSSFVQDGKRRAGYAVVTTTEVAEAEALPIDTSAQKAELITLRQALRIAKGKWTTADEGIQYLRELAVLEVIYSDLDDEEVSKDPGDVLRTWAMWRKVIPSAPASYSNSLAAMYFPDMDTPTVEKVSSWLQIFEENLCTSSLRASTLAVRVQKSDGGWRLTVDYRGLNKVTPPLSAAVLDMLELQYELESKAAKWYATFDIANAFFSIPLAAECRPQFAFTWRGVQYTWNQLPQGWKHSPTICHGLIQTALEKGEAPEHLQYIDDIIVWGNKAEEVFKKGKRVIQILLKAGFSIKKSKVKGPAQEIQFLGIKWQDGRRHVPMDVVNKIATMSPPANKKETQAFLGLVRFWRMHIPGYSQLVSPLYRVTQKKNYFEWGLEQQQAFEHIKQEIARAVALGPVQTGPAVQNVLYTAAGEHGLTWSLWQNTAGETRGRPLGFWS
ncbi:hypothetical protein GRJ2_003463500 [Grus japonensis]|uniref:ribonuclease H n=1 Tax=Grus japonensis TaxID=30415 RepID=A0ABC9YIT0_GRUJA